MNTTHLIQLPLVIAVVLLASCSPSPKSTATQRAEASAKALDKVKTETRETGKAIEDYAHAQRVEFASRMKVELDASKRELDLIATKLKTASASVQAKAEPKVKELRDQIAKLEAQLETVKNSPESTWSSVKSGFSSAWESTQSGLNEARQWVSDQIQP
jgi:chromosome segregation ATPase